MQRLGRAVLGCMVTVALLALTVAAPSPSSAASEAVVEGRLVDGSGAPLVDASVIVYFATGHTDPIPTGDDGGFSAVVPMSSSTEDVSATAHADGFHPQNIGGVLGFDNGEPYLTVRAGRTLELGDVELLPSDQAAVILARPTLKFIPGASTGFCAREFSAAFHAGLSYVGNGMSSLRGSLTVRDASGHRVGGTGVKLTKGAGGTSTSGGGTDCGCTLESMRAAPDWRFLTATLAVRGHPELTTSVKGQVVGLPQCYRTRLTLVRDLRPTLWVYFDANGLTSRPAPTARIYVNGRLVRAQTFRHDQVRLVLVPYLRAGMNRVTVKAVVARPLRAPRPKTIVIHR